MTIEERAGNIAQVATDICEKAGVFNVAIGIKIREAGATQLREAVEEANSRNAFYVAEKKKWFAEGQKVGEAIAYEDAAKITEQIVYDGYEPGSHTSAKICGDMIRARAKEVCGNKEANL